MISQKLNGLNLEPVFQFNFEWKTLAVVSEDCLKNEIQIAQSPFNFLSQFYREFNLCFGFQYNFKSKNP